MPIYDYRCSSCGHEVEVIHGIDADGPATCDVCGASMRKALSTPAIHFKGSGWAKKDAQTADKKPSASSAAAATAEASTVGADGSKASTGPDESGSDGSGKSSAAETKTAGSGDDSGTATKSPTGTATG